MRQALKRNPSRQQQVTARQIPAPTGGWNARDALAAMPATDAIILENWIPRPTYVELRRGYLSHVTGFADPTETLMAWRGTTEKLFAAAGADIYDVTTAGSVPSPSHTGATSARYKSVNFANDAGSYLIAVNGADTPIKYDGTTFSDTVITGAGPPALDPTTLIDVMMHKRRLHFIEDGSLRIWFLDVNAIAGAAGLLDLGPVFSKGGKLICETTWTLDGGFGPDDYAVYMTDQGQVAIYKGTDPSDATMWSLVGTYDIGEPLGNRALIKFGADVVVLTTDGIVPLSQALTKDRAAEDQIAITDKIKNAWALAVRQHRNNFGWDAILYPKGQMILCNIPVSELGESQQYNQVTQNGSWCNFTGWNAFCWAICEDNLYFGSTTGVFLADIGSSDRSLVITGDVKTAFNSFGNAIRTKQFTMMRPVLNTSGVVQPAIEMDVDYQESVPVAIPTTVDKADIGPHIRYDWTSAEGIGYVGAARMRVSLVGDIGGHLLIGIGSEILITGDGFDLALTDGLPFDVPCQLIGFDVMFQPGGQL